MTPISSGRHRSYRPRATIPCKTIAGREVRSCTCLCTKERMIHQFDHRANSVRVNPENSTHNPYLSEPVSELPRNTPTRTFLPQISILGSLRSGRGVDALPLKVEAMTLGLPRHVGRPTDVTHHHCFTLLALRQAYGNSTQSLLLLSAADSLLLVGMSLLTANLSTPCAFDFVASDRRVQGTTMNWFISRATPRHRAQGLRPAIRQHDRPRDR